MELRLPGGGGAKLVSPILGTSHFDFYMGVCQNYGPFLGTLNIRYRIVIGTKKRDHNFDNHPHVGGVV